MNDRHPNHPDNVDPRTGEIDDEPVLDGEVIEPMGTGVLATLHRVEIDQQIATAKAYPRNVPMIKKELTALVTMDEDTADDCIYALPRGQKHIKGPSARFADALISFWGNARSGAFITQVNKEDKFVEAIGSFQDVERNVIRQRRVRRPISDRQGRLYNPDMINMTGNAACVIAERNAILNGIPKSLWGPAYEQAFALVAGTTKTLGEKLQRAEKAFALMGISMEQVLAKLERPDISKVVPDDIVTMRGMLTALKTGEETVETIFGRGAGHQHETMQNPLKDDPKPQNVESGGKPAAAQAEPAANTTKTATVESVGKPDSISSGVTVRGVSHQVSLAEMVIEQDGTVSKIRGSDPGEVTGPVLDMRLKRSWFDSAREWAAAAEDLPEPVLLSKAGSGSEGAGAGAPGKAQEEGAKAPAPKEQAKPAAAQAEASGPEKPYSDGPSYIGFMRDKFDSAGRGAIVELWGSTRADRNEMLTREQIDALQDEKEVVLKKLKDKS